MARSRKSTEASFSQVLERSRSSQPPSEAQFITELPDSGKNRPQRIRAGTISLPELPTRLVGRERALAALVELLERPEVRLVTLVGFGGVGKTHLAIEAARQAAAGYDLVHFVDLAPVDATGVMAATARALGFELRPDIAPVEQLSGALRGERALLLMDNFEHVLEAAPQIAALLATTRELHILVTSRAPLHLRWEYVQRLQPLPAPNICEALTLDELAALPAVELFVGHLQRLDAGFTLDQENAGLVGALCRRLDGLPLALELAAAILQTCSLQQLHERLDAGIDALHYDLRDLPNRQTSIRATLDWSFGMLTPQEQRVARQAAIFAGGGTLEAAGAVIELEPDAGPLNDVLVNLADKSLISFNPNQESAARFAMLQLTRAYLLEQLGSERAALEKRYADYFLELARRLASGLRERLDSTAIGALHEERGNFRALLHEATLGRDPARGLQLALTLDDYWYRSGQLTEATYWFERLLPHFSAPEQAEARLATLLRAGNYARYRGDFNAAARYLVEALDVLDGAPHEQLAETIINLAHVRMTQGDPEAAGELLERLAASTDADPQRQEALYLRGAVLAVENRFAEARKQLAGFLETPAGETGELMVRATLLLADLDLIEENYAAAQRGYAEVVSHARASSDWRLETRGLIGLGIVASRLPNGVPALDQLTDAFEIAAHHGDEFGVALAIDGLATLGLSVTLIRAEWLPLAGLADALFEQLGVAPQAIERRRTAAHRRLVREVLGDSEADRVEAEGRRMSIADVRARLDEASPDETQEEPSGTSAAQDEQGEGVRLTRREREVVRLVARGLTNRQIALKLDIAERTVDTHVTNIFKKLGVSSRVNVAAWAVERGMANY